MRRLHAEKHLVKRIGWLRAAVLGANDGIISTASLIVGVASANPSSSEVLITGIAGMVAGSMSMAAGIGPIAIGTDGGGSIRCPASCAGVLGLKPTLERDVFRQNR